MHTMNVSLVKTHNALKSGTQPNLTRISFGNTQDKTDFSAKEQAPKRSLKEIIIDFFNKIISWFKIEKNEDHKVTDIKTATARLKKANQVMTDLVRIIEEDQQRAIPVFKSIKVGTFQKLFNHAYRRPEHSFTVGITGGSASGKSYVTETFTESLLAKCPEDKNGMPAVSTIYQDNYYKDFSKLVKKIGTDRFHQETNLDHPKSVNLAQLEKDLMKLKAGFEIKTPKYSMNGTGISIPNKVPVKPAPLVLVEGLFTLTNDKLRDLMDLKVFVDASKEVRAERWWKRAEKRGVHNDAAGNALFNRTFAMHDKFVEPSKRKADIVINAESKLEDTNKVIKQIADAISRPVMFTGNLIKSLKKTA